MTTPAPKRRPTARFAKLYAGAWLGLASLSIAYIVTVAMQPGSLADLAAARSAATDSESNAAVARFATDLTGLKQSVGDIKAEVASLRTAVEGSAAREKEVVERLAAVEARSKTTVAAAEVAPAAPAPAPAVAVAAQPKTAAQRQAEARAKKAADKAAAQASAAEAGAAAAALPAPNVTVLNAPPAAPAANANPLATGSIVPVSPPAHGVPAPPPPAAAPVFGPGAIKAAAPPQQSAVELASGPSLDSLRLNWSLLADQNGAALKNLEPRYTNSGDGQPYQLVAGPLGSPEEAARVCAQLKAKRVACRVTGFGGNAL